MDFGRRSMPGFAATNKRRNKRHDTRHYCNQVLERNGARIELCCRMQKKDGKIFVLYTYKAVRIDSICNAVKSIAHNDALESMPKTYIP